jgi:hypothetical protein
MGHLVSIRRRTPYFSELLSAKTPAERTRMLRAALTPRWQILLAWVGALTAAVIFNEIPALQVPCGTASVPAEYWFMAFAWSIACFCVGEVRKWIIFVYPRGWLARMAW